MVDSSHDDNTHYSSHQIQELNWQGAIPVVVTLAASSVSSPQPPAPIHVLVGRHTYLFLALERAVRQLHAFAPMTVLSSLSSGKVLRNEEPDPGESFGKDDDNDDKDASESTAQSSSAPAPAEGSDSSTTTTTTTQKEEKTKELYPICWFEDEVTRTPLRWQFFAGVLFDSLSNRSNNNTTTSLLPWKIRLHFTAAYPTTQILPLSASSNNNNNNNHENDTVIHQVRHYYKNSLKQALCVLHGNNKLAVNLSKGSHGRLWEAICRERYDVFQTVKVVDSNNNKNTMIQQRIPVRLLVDDRPPLQRPCEVVQNSSDTTTPTPTPTTLGDYLSLHLPRVFSPQAQAAAEQQSQPSSDEIQWTVAGLSRPPLETPMFQLWQDLMHPDFFLHIMVHTTTIG